MQDSHAGIAQFLASVNLVLIISGRIVLLPFGSSNVRALIISFMRYMITPSFQIQVNNDF